MLLHAGDGGEPATPLLPDILPWADESREYIHGWVTDTFSEPGRTLLRLTTATANIGDGALEVRGGSVLPNGNQEVVQRVYDDAGGFTDHLAGEFTFHPEHGHVHFDEYSQYHLREFLPGGGVGDIVAAGEKVSFCLIDSQAYPGFSTAETYSECNEIQGISVGWADVYFLQLPDQDIDITDVPDGDYWLEVVVDPFNHLLEADETNNVARIPIQLGGIEGDDRFEVNDSFAAAANLQVLGNRTELDLSISAPGDDDYFELVALTDGIMNVDASFDHSEGNLDLAVYDGNEQLIASSATHTDLEHITLQVAGGDTYFVHVFGIFGATNPDYDLQIDGPDNVISTWDFDGSGSWFDILKWTPNEPPNGDSSNAIFGDIITSPSVITTDSLVQVNSIQFDNANSYTIDGSGHLDLDISQSFQAPSIDVLQGQHTFLVDAELHGSAAIILANGSSLNFHGQLDLHGNVLSVTGEGRVLVNNSSNTGSGTVEVLSGHLMGSGTVAGNVHNHAGTTSPGSSLGILQVNGSLTHESEATLHIEIAGNAISEHDRLLVSETATLDGTLEVLPVNGYPDPLGRGQVDRFEIVTAGSIEGIFDELAYDGQTLDAYFESADVNRYHVDNGLFRNVTNTGTAVELVNAMALWGDTDGDLDVDIVDFNTLALQFNPLVANPALDWTLADFDGNQFVNIVDFNALATNFSPFGYAGGGNLAAASGGDAAAELVTQAPEFSHIDQTDIKREVDDPSGVDVLNAVVDNLFANSSGELVSDSLASPQVSGAHSSETLWAVRGLANRRMLAGDVEL